MNSLVVILALNFSHSLTLATADDASVNLRSAAASSEIANLERASSGTGKHQDLARSTKEDSTWSVAAVPTLIYNSDEGFGTGGVATLYHRADGLAPYKDAITLKLYISTKLVQGHELSWDGLQVGNLPLRIFARIGFFSTVTQNFCGYGNAVNCDPNLAISKAKERGLSEGSEDYDSFVRNYYQMRFMRPYADLLLRYKLRDMPHRLEILAGWRGSWEIPGDFSHRTPYPGSLYAETFAQGESGISSAPFLGFILDNRDAETFPTRGYVLESSLRAAAAWTGSTWTYAGGNLSFATFHRFLGSRRTIFASRMLADVVVGEPSTEQMARTGGSTDEIAFGGQAMGRGIREQRYLGKVKGIYQAELRSKIWDLSFWGQDFNLGGALFTDVAGIIYDLQDPRGDPGKLVWGAGGSFRIIWNRDFVIRFDLAGSPSEPGRPGVYIQVGNVF